MNKKDLKAKDLLLTLLFLPGINNEYNEPIDGRTRITKMFYLFDKEIVQYFNNFNIINMPEFFAYNYGPFSKELLDDIGFFSAIGFVNEKTLEQPMSESEAAEYCFDKYDDIGYGEESESCEKENPLEVSYYLTEKGIEYVKENVINNFSEDQIELLTKFKSKINALPLDAIIEYVYKKYPESAEKSKIKDKYLKN
ncbi:MAG: hypothetical protein K0S75_831 [Clostridia bacterium]|jgi:uncharacterized protein YwgA|nr:hypothetical protein [Clostridia bacterium]